MTQIAVEIELYWMPGCTACLRAKEFLEATGVDYSAVNVEASAEGAAKLARLGAHLPAVCIGDRWVNAVDLKSVADLVGVPYVRPKILEPSSLADKYRVIMTALIGLIEDLPESAYKVTLPDRNRYALDLCIHAASIMRYFLKIYYDDNDGVSFEELMSQIGSADGGALASDATRAGEETLRMFADWWERDGYDDPLENVVSTYWGHRTTHEALEREVWHTAQHTRQIAYILHLVGVTSTYGLSSDDLSGLPMPERIHD